MSRETSNLSESIPVFSEDTYKRLDDELEWYISNNSKWMYSPSDNVYVHVDTKAMFVSSQLADGSASFIKLPNDEDTNEMHNTYKANEEEDEEEEVGSRDSSQEEEDIELDVMKDVYATTFFHKDKAESEDDGGIRYITKELLPVDIISDTQACCVCSSIFSGVAGSKCTDYCHQHLYKNVLSLFRQLLPALREKQLKKKKNRRQSSDLDALRQSLQNGFQMTDHNYLDYSRRNDLNDGCSICALTIFGPDVDGSLKIISSHVGNCAAVMCREGKPFRLTNVHTFNVEEERKRVKALGGEIESVNNNWVVKAKVNQVKSPTFSLSVSRAIGLADVKKHGHIVSPFPEINIHPLNFDTDAFVVMASPALWLQLSDQAVVDTVLSKIQTMKPQQIAQSIIDDLEYRQGQGSICVTLIFFKWASLLENVEFTEQTPLPEQGNDSSKNDVKENEKNDGDEFFERLARKRNRVEEESEPLKEDEEKAESDDEVDMFS